MLGRRALIAVTAAALALLTPAFAGAAKPQPGVWQLKAGQIVTFGSISISGCNQLVGGVVWEDNSTDTFASLPGGSPCFGSSGDMVFGPFSASRSFRLYLEDVSCSRTYYSDGTSTGGTSADHATIAKSGKQSLVSFGDGGFVGDGCLRADTDVGTSFGASNFEASVTISRH